MYAACSGVSTACLHVALLNFLEMPVDEILLHIDSKAAKAILEKIGVGNIRHFEVKQLWIQDLVQKKAVRVPQDLDVVA